jgi:uncharacterized ferritin-like protein (DUF455 family)
MTDFITELETFAAARLAPIVDAGRDATGGDRKKLLEVALANEVAVAELAATWVATTAELDAKLAFARQAGDEAGHFQLVADRLAAHGFDLDAYRVPTANPLFQHLAALTATLDRIAAGLFTLEMIAYGVNENFIAFCRANGDLETVRLYDTIIQPEEREHHELGKRLLAKYATTPELQAHAHAVVEKVLAIAAATRAAAATRLGVACFPGC